MKNIHGYIVAMLFLSITIPVAVHAATGTIDAVFKYAWSENIGWLNFNATVGDVQVTDTQLTGSVWSENTGWISLHPSVSTYVHNDGQGNLSGHAWGEGIGYIDFSGVTIDSEGYFHGYASSTNAGMISFNCANTSSCNTADFKVKTFWRPPTALSGSGVSGTGGGGSGGGGGAGGGVSGFIGTSTTQVLYPLVPTLPKAYASTTTQQLENAARSPYGKACLLVNTYTPPLLTRDLSSGSVGPDVMHLQKFLNTNGYVLTYTEAGAYGRETTRFGTLTRNALAKFQRVNGITGELGQLGPQTRLAINARAKNMAAPSSKSVICNVNQCPQYLTKYIKMGEKNDPAEVTKLTQFLKNYEGFSGLSTSSVYTSQAFNAVVTFQERYTVNILGPWSIQKGTGWVYQTTTAHINYLYCKYEYEKLLGLKK